MRKTEIHKLVAIFPTLFTAIVILVGLISAFVVIRDNLISLQKFIGGTLLVVLSWFFATAVSTLFFKVFLKKYSFNVRFLDVLGTYYRTYLSNLGFPGALGSGLKLKRLSSRSRVDLALSFLFLERMYSIILQSLFIAFISFVLFSEIPIQNYEGLVAFGGLALIFGALLIFLFPKILVLSIGILEWASKKFRLNLPRFSISTNLSFSSHLLVSLNVLFPMAIRLSTAAFVGELILPSSFLWVLFARSLASLASMLPLPISTLLAREGTFVGAMLLAGFNYDMVLTLSATFVLSTVGNGLIGLLFEFPIAARGLKKRLRGEPSRPANHNKENSDEPEIG